MCDGYFDCSNNDEAEEEEDLEKLKKKCEVWWGLSDSSTNLARELLPTEFVTLSPSKEMAALESKPSSAPELEASHLESNCEENGDEAKATEVLQPIQPSPTDEGTNGKTDLTNENVCYVWCTCVMCEPLYMHGSQSVLFTEVTNVVK